MCGLGFRIKFPHVSLQLALGHGEFALRLLASQVSLYHLAPRRAPVPYGDIQRGSHGVAKVPRPIRLVRSKMRRVDAVKIIERERGKVSALCGGYLELGRLETCRRGPNIRVPVLRRLDE